MQQNLRNIFSQCHQVWCAFCCCFYMSSHIWICYEQFILTIMDIVIEVCYFILEKITTKGVYKYLDILYIYVPYMIAISKYIQNIIVPSFLQFGAKQDKFATCFKDRQFS